MTKDKKIMEYEMPTNFLDFFNSGMARQKENFYQPLTGISLNIGSGNKKIKNCHDFDYPEFNAETDKLPFSDGVVSNIFLYHILEHIQNIVPFLKECQRVLKIGGLIFICVPYYTSELAFEDLDHKRFFTESTFKTLLNNSFYNKDKLGWKLEITFNMIVGETQRNLCLLTQLVKK